jgi:ketosteroid isomerase-like protein
MSAIEDWPESETYAGHEGIRRFYEDWFGRWEQMAFELERVEAGGDVILSVVVQRGTGTSSRAPVEQRVALLTTVKGSKFVRAQFLDPEDAIRAATGD